MANIEQLKQLREETSAPVKECMKALEEAKGDIPKAKEILKKLGKILAEKKVEREVKEGIIDSYLHPNKKVGVVLELRCESDFVAKSKDFQNLSHELCLHITATNPCFISEQDIPEEVKGKERAMYAEQVAEAGKDQKIADQIIEGKWAKYKQETCLLEQSWVKDDSKKIKELITEAIAKLGENIVVRDFKRLSIR
ncbi:elongation factor Ts [Candidatus Parcubacteria bacterium]|nr:elongation factor Ts [Patescibacteria group bacterium]MBU4466517.1 elongation factor Ts [Patescibacteria group bacterium]MCG2688328.1 elongation factor Ts [Candidatus Parcubacteria bacterium]